MWKSNVSNHKNGNLNLFFEMKWFNCAAKFRDEFMEYLSKASLEITNDN